ncbi:hypothetical protein J27TS7_11060 [Paenibacillus dendritiformis]|uniref:DUF2634 domain-containing protein n=1 Tax=Paenibacillus dendritiformis TaxID=130049 RepID=UPI001B2F82CA|nr:DUF2634 domain-containing protein [Paenibacillus dendritiformis]GIO71592.1 hypothetical protein J27TS7_11060 [Paenibacillus dendritiformis]
MPNLFPVDIENDWTEETEEATEPDVAFGRSWRFDFEKGDFVMTPTRKVAAANETEAWIMWCEKAIRTPRYRHLIYSREHGEEFDSLIGKGYSRAVIESEIQRIVTETLMVDPRTASVDGFTFSWSGDGCHFSCRIQNVREETEAIEGRVET